MSTTDQKLMKQALGLAAKGGRAVAPNPMVGAVIAKNGKVLSKGYHSKFGEPHAEVLAVQSVKRKADLQGATIYVTLEPCRHHGKTPPCLDLLRSVGITRIICGSRDPFQKGSPPKELEFLSGSVAAECRELNKFFFTWVTKKRPYLTVKIATSADGFVAGRNRKTMHFTSAAQDRKVHSLRAQHQAIMVGSGTVLADNPHLGVRLVKGEDPLRIILDFHKRIPKTSRVFRDRNYMHVTKKTTFKKLMKDLAKQGVASVLAEPGPILYQVLKREGLIDELIILKGRKKIHQGLPIDL